MKYKVYDYILQGHEYEETSPMTAAMALHYGDLDCDFEETNELPSHREYKDFFREIQIYYDYAGDYYFFVERI